MSNIGEWGNYLQSRFSLAYPPGATGGMHAICLGAFPLLRDNPVRQNQIALDLDGRKAISPPNFAVDPLGFAFSACPVSSRRLLLSNLASAPSQTDRFFLLQHAAWNVFHIHLSEHCLSLLSATCEKNGVNGVTDFSDDAALVNRLKQQSVHLFIPPDSHFYCESASVTELRQEAIERLKEIQPGFRINLNWEKPKIFRRARGLLLPGDEVSVRLSLQLPAAIRLRCRMSAVQEEIDDGKARQEAENDAATQDRSLGARQSASRRVQCEFSALPPLGGVTESGLNSLRAWTVANWSQNEIALLLALEDIAHLSDDSMESARIEEHGRAAYLVTSCPYLTSNAPLDPSLHLAVRDEFWRPIPLALADAAKSLLLCKDTEKLLSERDLLLRDRFRTTFAKLRHAWHYNAPTWDNTTWLGSEFGLRSVRFDEHGKPKMPGFRSYLVWDPAVHETRTLKSLTARGWEIEADPDVGSIPRCGSRNCPRPTIISELVEALAELVALARYQTPVRYVELACMLNAIAALTRILEVLLTFARNYPSQSPWMIPVPGGFELLEPVAITQEKIRMRPLVYGHELRGLLNAVADIFATVFADLRAKNFVFERNGEPESEYYAYSFLSHRPNGKVIPLQHPRKSLVSDGLLHHPVTEKFGAIALNGMRNLNYYLLTSTPLYDRAVQDLCDHLPAGGQGTLDRGCAGSVANIGVREKAARSLIGKPGDWPWR